MGREKGVARRVAISLCLEPESICILAAERFDAIRIHPYNAKERAGGAVKGAEYRSEAPLPSR